MDEAYRQRLEKNIVLQSVFRTMNKRAYLPLIAVYAVAVAHLNFTEFGLIASITAAFSLVMEVPTGYISDWAGHKKAIILGHFMMALSSLGYVFLPNFWGVLIGSAGYFGGYSFLSGTNEAFLHETLTELGRKEEYGKVMGRQQGTSLLWNALIIALVPLLYPLNPKLPFLIGFLMLGTSFILSFALTEPRIREKAAEFEDLNLLRLIKPLWKTNQFVLFLVLGITGASADKILEFKELYYQSFGIPVPIFGLLAAASSLLAAAVSYNIHRLEWLKANQYYALSFITLFSLTAVSGVAGWSWLGVAVLISMTVYNRNEDALTKAYILRNCPTERLKATYISLLAFIQALMGIWIPLAIGYLATRYGVRNGYAYFGASMLIFTAVIFFTYLRGQKKIGIAVK